MNNDLREAMTDIPRMEYDLREIIKQIAELTQEIIKLKTTKKILILKYETLTIQVAKLKGEIP